MKTLVPLVPSWFVFLDVLQQDFGGNGGVEVELQLTLQPQSVAPLGLTPQAKCLSRLRRSPLTELLSRRLVPQ